jgi:hypothetical protein
MMCDNDFNNNISKNGNYTFSQCVCKYYPGYFKFRDFNLNKR